MGNPHTLAQNLRQRAMDPGPSAVSQSPSSACPAPGALNKDDRVPEPGLSIQALRGRGDRLEEGPIGTSDAALPESEAIKTANLVNS